MSLIGGYQVIDFSSVSNFTPGSAQKIVGVFDKIANTNKEIKISGATLSNVKYHDFSINPVLSGTTYSANVYMGTTLYTLSIVQNTSDNTGDSITFTAVIQS